MFFLPHDDGMVETEIIPNIYRPFDSSTIRIYQPLLKLKDSIFFLWVRPGRAEGLQRQEATRSSRLYRAGT